MQLGFDWPCMSLSWMEQYLRWTKSGGKVSRDAHCVKVRAHCVSVKRLEQIDGLLEEIRNFLLRGISSIAAGLQCTDTGAVLAPFMFPETLVVSVLIQPVLIHIIQQVILAVRLQNLRDIGVCTR